MSVLIKSKLSDDSVSFLLPVEILHDDVADTAEQKKTNIVEPGAPKTVMNETINEIDVEIENIPEELFAEVSKPSFNQDELDALKETAKEEGYREGYQKALDDVKSQYTTKLQALDAIAASLNDSLPDYLNQSEHTIAAIVFCALRKIVGDTLSDKSKALTIVKETIQSVDYQQIREVLVSQSDFDAIQVLADDFLTESQSDTGAHLTALNMKADPTITLGGCKVKLVDGYLNATIQSQLDMLANALTVKAESMRNE